ncbi:NAD-dependent epimerase/dehydratase family protein [Thermoleophilia bacterium SCSIO 60948]|nr:NAD-dependent epimerase/dehydratase family protein [Thermoleophilia bacterium SCSIO 60948]
MSSAMTPAQDRRARRVLITGLSTYWGGRLAEALEADDAIEAIVGVDSREPTRELNRTEFVRVSNQHALLERIVRAAAIDTVIDTRMIVNSAVAPAAVRHENNVLGTMNILAACSGADSPVRKFVFKSSSLAYGSFADDPAFFTEDMTRKHPASTSLENDIDEAEAAVEEFASRNPDVTVTCLRCANVLGPDVVTNFTRMFALPVIPTILGFDPRIGFVHEDDIVHALEHAAFYDLPGCFNVVGDGVLVMSEVISLLGKRAAPVLPPFKAGAVLAALRALGLGMPPEMVEMMRFGRGLDNRRLKATGFEYGYTSRETVVEFGEKLRLNAVMRGMESSYIYEREVEDFLRWSPLVNREGSSGG